MRIYYCVVQHGAEGEEKNKQPKVSFLSGCSVT